MYRTLAHGRPPGLRWSTAKRYTLLMRRVRRCRITSQVRVGMRDMLLSNTFQGHISPSMATTTRGARVL